MSATSSIDQPPPKPNDGPDVWHLVIADMIERHKVGVARYGTPLQPFNGRDALADLLAELLDACVYTRQFQEELKWLGSQLRALHARLVEAPCLDADSTAEIATLLASLLQKSPALSAE